MRHLLRGVVSVFAGLLILLDEVARPLFRPLSRVFGRLRLVEAVEGWIARLPAYAVLGCLLVPFILVEPLKVLGLLWVAEGRAKSGALLLLVAYLGSFLIVDRIYHAGREGLLTIGWFAAMMSWLAALRDSVLAPIRRSVIYKMAIQAALRVRMLLRLRRASSPER